MYKAIIFLFVCGSFFSSNWAEDAPLSDLQWKILDRFEMELGQKQPKDWKLGEKSFSELNFAPHKEGLEVVLTQKPSKENGRFVLEKHFSDLRLGEHFGLQLRVKAKSTGGRLTLRVGETSNAVYWYSQEKDDWQILRIAFNVHKPSLTLILEGENLTRFSKESRFIFGELSYALAKEPIPVPQPPLKEIILWEAYRNLGEFLDDEWGVKEHTLVHLSEPNGDPNSQVKVQFSIDLLKGGKSVKWGCRSVSIRRLPSEHWVLTEKTKVELIDWIKQH